MCSVKMFSPSLPVYLYSRATWPEAVLLRFHTGFSASLRSDLGMILGSKWNLLVGAHGSSCIWKGQAPLRLFCTCLELTFIPMDPFLPSS